MIGKTNGVSIANATKDATATADSLLYGHTAYGADGTKLTGTGAYWQYALALQNIFGVGSLQTGDISLYTPLCRSMHHAFYASKFSNIEVWFDESVANFSMYEAFFAASNLVTVTLHNSTLNVTNFGYIIGNNLLLTGIYGEPLDFSSMTSNVGAFQNCPSLTYIRVVPNTIKISIGFVGTTVNLSTASLLSIANGLNAGTPATLKMHATSKTNMGNINVDVVDGVAILGTTKTLTQFITTDKGWTIA